MAVIRFEEADHYLASGKPPWPPIFLLFGEEVLYKKILDKLVTTLLGEASRTLNYEALEGLNENVPAALAAVNTYSLMMEPKIVALTEARMFLSRRNEVRLWQQAYDAARQDHMAKAARYFRDGLGLRQLQYEDLEGRDDWQDLLGASPGSDGWDWARPVLAFCREGALAIPQASDPAQLLEEAITQGFPGGHHMIITTPWIDKRRRLFKALDERGVVMDCSVPVGDRKADRAAQSVVLDLTVDEILKKHRKTMTPEARQALYGLTGFDLRTVAANVDKLVNYSGERAAISGDDVRRILERTRRDPLYEFTDAVTDRNLEQALFYLQSLLAGGEFDHPLPLLAAVANQVRKLIVAKAFTQSPLGKGWYSGCAYPLFQKQVLPAIKTFDTQMQERLDEWQGLMAATPAAPPAKGKRTKKRKLTSDLTLMGRSRSPYPVYRILIKTGRFTHRELLTALAAVSRADRRLKRSGIGGRNILEKVIIGICQRENPHGR